MSEVSGRSDHMRNHRAAEVRYGQVVYGAPDSPDISRGEVARPDYTEPPTVPPEALSPLTMPATRTPEDRPYPRPVAVAPGLPARHERVVTDPASVSDPVPLLSAFALPITAGNRQEAALNKPVALSQVRERPAAPTPADAPNAGRHRQPETTYDPGQFTFTGLPVSPEERHKIMQRTDDLGRLSCPGEVQLTLPERVLTERFNAGADRLGEEVRVDISGRGGLERLHVMPDRATYKAAIEGRVGESAGNDISRGSSHPKIGSVVMRTQDLHEDVYVIAHEEMHNRAHWLITMDTPRPDTAAERIIAGYLPHYSIGYGELGSGDAHFDEAVNDMATDRVNVNMRGTHPPHYRLTAALLSSVILHTAPRIGATPVEMENGIIAGMLGPDCSMFNALDEQLDGQLAALFSMVGNAATIRAVELAVAPYRLTTFERQLPLLASGTYTQFYNWPGRKFSARRHVV